MKLPQMENEWSQEDEEVNDQNSRLFLNIEEKKTKIWKAATGAVEHFGYFPVSGKSKRAALLEKIYINKSENQSGESTGEELVVNFTLLIILQVRFWF